MNEQLPSPDEEPKRFEPVWKPKAEREIVGSLWTNAAIGFGITVATGFITVPLLANLPARFVAGVAATVFVGLIVVLAGVSAKTHRTGLVGGALLAAGFCLLCPFVGLFVICGGVKL